MASIVREFAELGFPWATVDPFLFCAFHRDAYPAGNGRMGVESTRLRGRRLGMDFESRDGFRMYHGRAVPGFPSHPHRGFETVTLVRQGYCDHSDSLGAAARFGVGDAQWITTGAGVVHAEMFPLLDDERDNPLELFQIWLNLPGEQKMAPAHFKMLWRHEIPKVELDSASGKKTVITVVAGAFGEARPPEPPPHSWASRPENDVAIWTIEMEAGASARLPKARVGSHRALYFFEGQGIAIGGEFFERHGLYLVRPDVELEIGARGASAGVLLLQGQPIGQPVAQHGPFVMNTRTELAETFRDYQRSGFGGWPWPDEAPVHDKGRGRFALQPDGSLEELPR